MQADRQAELNRPACENFLCSASPSRHFLQVFCQELVRSHFSEYLHVPSIAVKSNDKRPDLEVCAAVASGNKDGREKRQAGENDDRDEEDKPSREREQSRDR
ncbi:hypothetical protein MN608_00524 [Microdochium nivale]|nr:hypothetical protein MN608_00524 [Microdochium nivale]